MEFLNFNQVGLISYFFHGDLNNTSSIRDSSRETSLESISGGGRPEGDRSMPHPLQRVEGISKKQEFRSEHLFINQYICQMQITELQKFF